MLAQFAAMGIGGDWPKRFACTAVDATSGEFKVWREEDGVDLARAIASSCSVPGIYPAIAINDRMWMDGGMRSGTNVDVAAGHEHGNDARQDERWAGTAVRADHARGL